VITSVTLTNLRGIKSGVLSQMTGLTILVGPNGSGKSTVLDGLSIGMASEPTAAVDDAVQRRLSRQSTARWLFPAQLNGPTVVKAASKDLVTRITTLTWKGSPDSSAGRVEVQLDRTDFGSPLGNGEIRFSSSGAVSKSWDEPTDPETQAALIKVDTHFIDMRFGALNTPDLVDVLTAAKAEGRAGFARDILKEVVPSLETIEILKVGSGFGVGLVNEKTAVPIDVSGDGLRGLARLSLELAARADGLVLLEEPEVHQHPRSLRMSARVIVAAVKRGIQVVLATHSLELIDNLIEFAEGEQLLDSLNVQRLLLANGQLDTKRFPGDQAKRIRSELELELR